MTDATSRQSTEPEGSTEDTELDELLRVVAHAPPRKPALEPVLSGTRWGAAGRYVIEDRLGRGGMGTVYSANDTLLNRVVALKVLDVGHSDDEAAHRARLLREARIAARVEHERIARVYDVGEHEGALFVAMELVRGVTLRSWMKGRVAAPGEILGIAGQIAEGLGALHASGVFHRDLKPENVMLTEQGGIRLLDFGLARHTTRGEAEGPGAGALVGLVDGESVGTFSGTPGYMAPEQCNGDPLDARVDVFALGVILYELVTGVRPFAGDRVHAILEATLRADPVFVDDDWQRVPSRLRAITTRMLSREPGARFADGGAALQVLREVAVEPAMPMVLLQAEMVQEIGEADTRVDPAPRRGWRVRMGIGVAALLSVATLGSAGMIAWRHRPVPLPAPAPGMVWIDVGTITVGHTPEELDRECAAIGPGCKRKRMQREVPATRVTVPPFQLDVYEVNNEEMAATLTRLRGSLHVVEDEEDHSLRFVRWNKDLGHDGEILADLDPVYGGVAYGPVEPGADQTYQARAGRERWPAVQVTWHGARLYCATRGKVLPTEDEWEAAARGRENRPFPWGSAPVRCGEVVIPRDGLISMPLSCPEKVTLAPVGSAAQDVTPEGIHDLGGNAGEWVDATFVEGNRAAHPDAGADLPKVVRGGSIYESLMARTSGRHPSIANGAGFNVAFRCASH